MKLIIDIPEEHYRTLQEAIKNHMESLIGKIILNGTVLPLDSVIEDIKAEIHATAEMHEDGDYYLRDKWIDEIIDKHIRGDK